MRSCYKKSKSSWFLSFIPLSNPLTAAAGQAQPMIGYVMQIKEQEITKQASPAQRELGRPAPAVAMAQESIIFGRSAQHVLSCLITSGYSRLFSSCNVCNRLNLISFLFYSTILHGYQIYQGLKVMSVLFFNILCHAISYRNQARYNINFDSQGSTIKICRGAHFFGHISEWHYLS